VDGRGPPARSRISIERHPIERQTRERWRIDRDHHVLRMQGAAIEHDLHSTGRIGPDIPYARVQTHSILRQPLRKLLAELPHAACGDCDVAAEEAAEDQLGDAR
jgi:hypothetical protein